MKLTIRLRYWMVWCLAMSLLASPSTLSAVDFANITITDGPNPLVDPPAVAIPSGQRTVLNAGLETEGFFIDGGAVVGEYPIRIGASAANDAANGVLITSIAENGREFLDLVAQPETIYAAPSFVRDNSATSTNTRGVAGGLALVADRAGNPAANSSVPIRSPMNANMAAAYFPFSQGWVGGNALSAGPGGPINQLVASPGLSLGTHVIPNGITTGNHIVRIPGVEDARRQGLLFTTHAHKEANYSMVSATLDGTGFNVTTHDNATNQSSETVENDIEAPFSFVFLPLGTPNITMASIHGASGPDAQPRAMLKSGGDFTVMFEDTGTYRLSIPGHSPSSGTLLLNGTSSYEGFGGTPPDNIVTYQADGNDWLIQSRDLPNVGLQSGVQNQRNSYFSFAFLPFNAPPSAPGAIPSLNFTKKDVLGFNTTITELDYANNASGTTPPDMPGMYADITAGTAGIEFFTQRQNRGDNGVTADGAFLNREDGVMFATISEGLRDNSATGGLFEYGVIGVSYEFGPNVWEIHTATADPSNGEHNINYSIALFGAESGFQMQANRAMDANAHLDLFIPGVNSLTDGVLMVTPYGNDDNFATVEPKSDGSGWDVDLYDNGIFREADSVNWIYLPYETENLIAGRVNEDGSLVNSTDTGSFSLVRASAGEYLLTINGRTPDDGMLLLNATGPNGSLDNSMAYEPDGNSFRILGLDMISSDEANMGALVDVEDTSFSFAFIDFITPPELPSSGFLEADFNQDGSVDSSDLALWEDGFGTVAGATKLQGDADGDGSVDGNDFLTWQRQFGSSNLVASQTTVPEPGSVALMLCGIAMMCGASRRGCRR